MTGQLHPAGITAPRSDAGVVRFGQRDIDGLVLCAEHYGAPYDLLAAALGAQPARLRAITARWRRAALSTAATSTRSLSGPPHRRHSPDHHRPARRPPH